MAGFGFSSLNIDFPETTSSIMMIAYLSITACAVGFQLCAILNAATMSVFGVGKFLRGGEGIKSANEAVLVLEEKSEITMQFFLMGFACIILSSALKSFVLHSFINGLIVSGGLCFMAWYMIKVGTRIKENLYVEKTNAISGEIVNHQVNDPTNIKL